MTFESVNPATDEVIATWSRMSSAEVQERLAATDAAQGKWAARSIEERAVPMRRLAGLLEARTEGLAAQMTDEMGKTIGQSRSEIGKCAWVCRFYADRAANLLARRVVEVDEGSAFVTFEPLGVVFAIMPWNFPFWQVLRCAAPTLMAGNGAVLKHAPNVFGCAAAIEELFREAGFPEGLFQSLRIDHDQAATVIAHPLVRAVTLTGSTRAGRAVAALAGGALKKSVLELGGSDPYIVLEDADLPAAVEACTVSRLINSGQSCIAAKRFVVVESVRAEFEAMLLARWQGIVPGDPRDDPPLGPLARRDLRDALHDQVQRSIRTGARCLVGGSVPEGPGAFYPATILGDVRPGMPAADEELFGPVAAILPVRDEDDAIRTANATTFGLGAAVFTRRRDHGERLAVSAVQAGSCAVNGFVQSDPRLPFGGIRDSGYGRELGLEGIREFVNVKTVHIR